MPTWVCGPKYLNSCDDEAPHLMQGVPGVTPPNGRLRHLEHLSSMPYHNLPAARTQLVGREQDSATVRGLVVQAPGRLVTLTGTGGSGKTQLALMVAAELVDAFADGVLLVELAAVQAPHLVPYALAAVLGLRERAGEALIDTLTVYLKAREVLLVLDNCEHLVDACAEVAERLLSACPRVRLLATSRERLRIGAEATWRVPSLRGPDSGAGATLTPAVLLTYPAVRLFVERAQAVEPDFALSPTAAASMVGICQRLEGLPLALELAAARVSTLSLPQILERLDDCFRLLVGGSRTAPTRQQTLRATVEWSYALLDERERRLFERLAVFAGGWSLEAAEAVCGDDGSESGDVLDVLGQLVNKSLMVADATVDGRVRYRMLETLRQYALKRLVASGHEPGVRARHAKYFLELAEAAAPQLSGHEQVSWLARLEGDHDNLRAALARNLEHPSDAAPALRLAGSLYRFWWAHGHLAEGRTWLARALDRDARLGHDGSPATKPARLRALEASGVLARQQGDYHAAESLFVASLALARELNDAVAIAGSLYWLGSTLFFLGDEQGARALAEESLALYQQLGNPGDICRPLGTLAELALTSGDYAQAIALHEERLRYARDAADTLGVAGIQRYLGMLAGEQGQHDRATRLLDASYRTFEELAYPEGMAMTLANLAWVSRAQGDASRAKQQFGQSLALFQKLGATWGIAECLAGLARLATDGAQFDIAARLFGSAAMLHETHSIRLANYQVAERAGGTRSVTAEQDLETVRAALGTRRFEPLWQAGRELTVDDAVTFALAAAWLVPPEAGSDPDPRRAPTMIGLLTPRQQEVTVLVAQGLTNRQIGERLVITERAAAAHVENILNRLGFNSRTQIAVWASEHGLLTGRADEPARN